MADAGKITRVPFMTTLALAWVAKVIDTKKVSERAARH
ncbi:hypothetical protein KPSA3_03824 [Pseudomonas syringae pv. actinidiae]|uniref:Uncharacterized protein n=1 Tax=Pseudomonas syringae pv. actinidiae TaxID=103796 RepID=A0AAN4Q5P9_PSESF|nr:hypothetical protein KPSA3_03824 [Pseudomonas syringae pv. actinidiae]